MSLRIRDWDKHFENASSRKLKRLDWVAVPIKTDGEGYTALVDHPNGAAHLGAWYAIVEAAAKQTPKENRGMLPGGIPQGVGGICQSLGRMSRLPSGIFQEVIPRLLEIGWLEEVQSNQQSATTSAESPKTLAESATTSADCGVTGQDRTGQGTTGQDIAAVAERMYALHPKKRNLVLVLPALESVVSKGTDTSTIEACHAEWCATEDWQKQSGRFAPKLDEWIADRGFTVHPNGKSPQQPVDMSKVIPYDPFRTAREKLEREAKEASK